MGYLLGTDEAGYGPNLGPLVVAATAWEVPDPPQECDLYSLCSKAICRRPLKNTRRSARLPIADSKSLYSPALGLAHLERGVLSACACLGQHPTSWQEIWARLAPAAADEIGAVPWHVDFDCPLPSVVDADELAATAATFHERLAAVGVRLVGIRAAVIFPRRFNALVDRCGSKGAVLSEITIRLAAELIDACGAGPVHLVCDKHGGRNFYGAILQEFCTDQLVEAREERADLSHYRWRRSCGSPVDAQFRPRAEAHVPTALASMTAKYLRELAMEPFNQYWQRHVPELRRTAGYNTDALRFKQQIAAAQTALGIDDRDLWRNR